MSFLDTLADKPAVVLDIGHVYTKCGFAGESSPHSIVPSKLTSSASSFFIYDYKKLLSQVENGEQGREEELLRELLIEFLYKIYYKVLNVNSRERKVIIVESILTPSIFRRVLNDVLLKNFMVVSVTFLSSHLAALFTLGISTALVVDCGYTDAQIMPIAEHLPMTGLCDFVDLGSRRVQDELRRLIVAHAYVEANDGTKQRLADIQPPIQLSDELIEDIKVRCCFVTTFERSQTFRNELKQRGLAANSSVELDLSQFEFKFAPDCEYNLLTSNSHAIWIPGYVREMACEILFVDEIEDTQSLQSLIINTLVKCPIDLKTVLSENIVLIGGTCLLAGFKARLVDELKSMLVRHEQTRQQQNDKENENKLVIKQFRFHRPPTIDNYTAWQGGAIFGALDIALAPLNI